MIRCLRLFIAAIALSAAPAGAWGPIGHRVSAEIAEHNINGHTAAEIEQIMGHMSLREASTIPDEQRNNPDPFWQGSAPWHRITVPRGGRVADIVHPASGDAMTALARFTAVLRDPAASTSDKQRALAFVVHLVADTHLPVHVNDAGRTGPGEMRAEWFGESTSVHGLWDEGLITLKRLSASEYAEQLAARTTPEEVIAWWQADPLVWMQESADLRDAVFADTEHATPPVQLGFQYAYDWTPTMEMRLRQSGYRLAAFLDWVFAPES